MNTEIEIKRVWDEYLEEIGNRRFDILKRRAAGETLKEIGKSYSITRERVRQLSEWAAHKFMDVAVVKSRFGNLLQEQFPCRDIIFAEEIESLVPDGDVLFYLLKRYTCSYNYDHYINALYVGGTFDLSDIYFFVRDFPFIIFEKTKLEYIKKIQSEFHVSLKFSTRIFEKEYYSHGGVWIKYHEPLTLKKTYAFILKHCFSDGVHTYDKKALDKVRECIEIIFGEERAKISDNALRANLVRAGVLCDRGMYTHKDNLPYPEMLLESIAIQFEATGREKISYRELFEAEKEALIKEGVTNKWMMHGLLKEKLDERYDFHTSYLKKYK